MKHFFYNALALNALPVHLLRQVYFFVFFGVFFSLRFLFVFLEALEGPLGAIGVDLGAIWGAFWGHFGDFFRIRGIFKNISFTEVKRYFLRFGRVLDRDFFMLCF